MELKEIVSKMVNFEALVEPQEMVGIVSAISGFITDYTLRHDELVLQHSLEWEQLKYSPTKFSVPEKPLSDTVTDMRMLRTDVSQELMKVKRTLGELKRYRTDLNRKLDVVLGIRRRN